MGDVDHDEIDASADELGRPLEIVAFGANGGAHAQPPLGVPGGTRQALLLQDVLRGDEPDEDAVRVDERQFLDLPLDHDALGDVDRRRALVHDELRERRHARSDRRRAEAVAQRDEPDVALGDETLQLARFVDHGQRADTVPRHDLDSLRQ